MRNILYIFLCILTVALTGCGNPESTTPARDTFSRGKTFLAEAKERKAADSFQQAIFLDPEFSEPYIALAELYINRAELPQAMDVLKQLIDVYPDSADAYYLLGKCFLLQGNTADAEEPVEKAVALSSMPYDTALRQMAQFFIDTGKYDDAYKVYTHLISLNRYSAIASGNQNARNYYEVGIILLYQNEPEKAAGAFRKALYFDETFLPAYMPMGLLYVFLDSKESAMHCYTYLFNIQSSQAKRLYEIIKHTRETGTFEEFFAKYKQDFLGEN